MQNYRLFFLLGAIFCITRTEVLAQYPSFSSFWLSPQLTAPTAMAGNPYHQVTAHYRKKAFGDDLGYRSLLLSGQFPLYTKGNTQIGTLGVNLLRDESGTAYLFSTNGLLLSYLYDVSLSSRHHLVGGIQGGYFNRRMDWGKVTTDHQFSDGVFIPTLPHGESFQNGQSTALTTNVGLGYYLSDFEGEQVFHLGLGMLNANKGRFTYLETDENQAEPLKWVAYSQLRLISNPSFEVHSHLYWRSENKVHDVMGGFQLRKGVNQRASISEEHLGIGLYYSPDHTATLSMQLARQNWLVGLSYDIPFGDRVSRKIQNAAEVTLGWRMERPGSKRGTSNGNYRNQIPASKAKSPLPWKEKSKKHSYKEIKRKGPTYKSKRNKLKKNKKLPWKKNKKLFKKKRRKH